MEKIEFTRFIERYLENKMQTSEQRWFEKELHGNLWLRKELDLRRKTDSFIKNTEAMEFRRKLVQAENLYKKTKPVKRAFTSITAQYAAIFIGLVIISSFIFIFSKGKDPSRLAEKYVANYEPGTVSRASSSESNFEYTTALDFFSKGDYENAIFWFEKVAGVNESGVITADFMLGVTNMKVEKYQEAILPLTNVVENRDNLYVEDANWFLGLCYLNTENIEKTVKVMTEIAQSESIYCKDASKILRKIK